MRCLVIGFGSAGQHHARILKEMGHEVAVVSRRHPPNQQMCGQYWGFSDIRGALGAWMPEYAVIATQTVDHLNALQCVRQESARSILVEKPLFAKPRPISDFDEEFNAHVDHIAVGYNLRFHPVVRELRDRIAGRELYTAQFHVGQWLPTWRPDRNYRETDVNGVLRDLSHELDMMLWLCGWPKVLRALSGKASGLDIDSEDSAAIICSTERCPQVMVTQNYLDHAPRRQIAINYDGGSILADLVHHTLTETRPDGETTTAQYRVDKDTTYTAMHAAMIDGTDADLLCSLDEGLRVVNLISLIESCAKVPWERAA